MIFLLSLSIMWMNFFLQLVVKNQVVYTYGISECLSITLMIYTITKTKLIRLNGVHSVRIYSCLHQLMVRYSYGITLKLERSKLDTTMKMVLQNSYSHMRCIERITLRTLLGVFMLMRKTLLPVVILIALSRFGKWVKTFSLMKLTT